MIDEVIDEVKIHIQQLIARGTTLSIFIEQSSFQEGR